MGASVIFPQYLPPVVQTGKSTAAISEIGIVGDVVVGAVFTTWEIFFWLCIHKSVGANSKLTLLRSSLCSNWVDQNLGHDRKAAMAAN